MACKPVRRDRAREPYMHSGRTSRSGRGARSDGRATDRRVGGVILAGTQPWGDCALERVLPRPLVPVANRPLITYSLRWLFDAGICGVGICGNSHSEVLRKSLTCGRSAAFVPSEMMLDYYEDIAPRGPAGCVRDAGFASANDVLVVVDGTIVPLVDLEELIRVHCESGASLTVVVSSESATAGSADAALKPVGIYVFNRSSLVHVPPAGFQDIKETLVPRLYSSGERVVTYRVRVPSPRVAGVDSYLAVNDWILLDDTRMSEAFPGFRTLGEARIHPAASVDSTARLIGPILVGEGSRIDRGATVVGPAAIGAGCSIGEGAIVCRTSMWDDCAAEPGAVLDRCVLTHGSTVQSESAHRYVVFSQPPKRLSGVGRRFSNWMRVPNRTGAPVRLDGCAS